MPTDFAAMRQDKPGFLITTTGVVDHAHFLAFVSRTAAYCGLSGPARALRWLRIYGVTGDWTRLSPRQASRVLREAGYITAAMHRRVWPPPDDYELDKFAEGVAAGEIPAAG